MDDRRPTPNEDAVRDQLRHEAELVDASPEPPAGQEVPADQPPTGGEAGETAEEPVMEESPEETLRRERDEYLDLARRAQADFENYRKRAAKDAAAAGQRGKAGVLNELLPVLDNLERALQSAGEHEGDLVGGVRLVHSELIGVLKRNGVEQFDPVGETFDPGQHEALTMREQEGAEAGVVLDVVEKGYRAGEAILRPARVVVAA